MRRLVLLLVLALPTTAAAGDIVLPEDLEWCQPKVEVLEFFDETKELSDDMVDANASYAGVDGFLRLVFEEARLASIEFRFFESPDDVARVTRSLQKELGASTQKSHAEVWEREGGEKVSLKSQSEEIKVTWEVPIERCGSAGMSLDETDQEKADHEAMKKSKAIKYDPYADEVDPDKQIVKNKRKAEEKEKKKEQKKKDSGVKDADIDW